MGLLEWFDRQVSKSTYLDGRGEPLAIPRMVVAASMLAFIYSENIGRDITQFRKSVLIAMISIFGLSIINIIARISWHERVAFISYKAMRVLVVFVSLAICYYLNGLLERRSANTYIIRFLYAFSFTVIVCLLVDWVFYLLYLGDAIISIYTISLLTDVKNALPYNCQNNLEMCRRMTNLCQGLIGLEVTIVIVNLLILGLYEWLAEGLYLWDVWMDVWTYGYGCMDGGCMGHEWMVREWTDKWFELHPVIVWNFVLAVYIQNWIKVTLFLTQFRGDQMVHPSKADESEQTET